MPSFPEPEQWNGNDSEPMPSARRHDTQGHTYICMTCQWHGKACQAAEHHHENPAHRIRGKNWPETWPDCQWVESKPRDWRDDPAERATFEADAERDGWTHVQPDLLRASGE